MIYKLFTSERFWALVIGSVAFYLKSKGILGDPEMVLISTIMGGFITIRTVDRISDKQVESAKIGVGIPPSEAKEIPPIN